MPFVVRPVADVSREAGMNEQQTAAIEARGEVFVSAGAGTGKTSVLVERFVRAVCDDGVDVDSVLVITYTKRAAGELRARIRARLHELGRHDLARRLDGAWISTIHGFCNRLLKTYPLAAGLDPRFRELDEPQAAVLRSEAFESALVRFCHRSDPERLRLLATYGARGLRRMLTGVYETLRSAGRELVLELAEPSALDEPIAEWIDAARCLLDDASATDIQRAAAAQALELAATGDAERLLDLGGVRAKGERAATYEEARLRVERASLDAVAARDRGLLQTLLDAFAEEYQAAKDRESALDFEDLQLRARDLLQTNEHVRTRERLRFRHICVDEFQDTNRLQCELIDELAAHAESVFFVGDEFQSIYGFRHADVQVFRERRAAAERVLPLTLNYRSRAEVLAVVNELFGGEFGDEFQPLHASGDFPDPVFGTPVELLVTDKSSYAETDLHWRRAEARHIAHRVRELVDGGTAEPGEIVLLFAAGTDAEWYEEELRREGLATYRATGRGYFGQQQVVDLLAYLRLLHNRYDDRSLLTVLASPFVGVSNDALVLIRRNAPKRPLFTGIEKDLPPQLSAADERLLTAFLQRFRRLERDAARMSLERLCERIVSEHDYDLAVLAQWDGRRRYANMRKLGRLARSYEELRGPDIEGFVRFVSEQEAVGAKELEAVAEEEGGDAVRLLTIHGAKGLEFKVVVVADAGRDRQPPAPDEILALSDGRFGFKVVDPSTGKRIDASGYEQVREARKAEDDAERLRLYYVAMTRAVDRLIVSGAIDPERPSERTTPIGWVLDRLALRDELTRADGEPIELERGGARMLIRVDRYAPEPQPNDETAVVAEDGQLALFAPGAEPEPLPVAPQLHALASLPPPPIHRVRRLSYSALALFDRCSYRFYAERVANMSERAVRGEVPTAAAGLAGTEIGDAVHRLLERIDLAAPQLPEDAEALVRTWYPRASDDEVGQIRSLVQAYCDSDLARRVAKLPNAQKERHFSFEQDGVLLHGFLDVLSLDAGRAVVVDYKTNSLEEAAPEEIVESDYGLQRLVYALACMRAGANEVEVVYAFLERPDAVVASTLTAADAPSLEAELSAAIARIQSGEFVPTPSEFACASCPALDLVCAGPRLRSAGNLVAAAPA
jgi:ATP-dependent helicase/nuclease subunit A